MELLERVGKGVKKGDKIVFGGLTERSGDHLPAQLLVFHILTRRTIIASRCDRSPVSRNKFILPIE